MKLNDELFELWLACAAIALVVMVIGKFVG
jgi:hypothetical protein